MKSAAREGDSEVGAAGGRTDDRAGAWAGAWTADRTDGWTCASADTSADDWAVVRTAAGSGAFGRGGGISVGVPMAEDPMAWH